MFKTAKVSDSVFLHLLTMVCAYNHVAIEEVKPILESIKPDLLVRHPRCEIWRFRSANCLVLRIDVDER